MLPDKIAYVDVDWTALDLGTEWLGRYNRDWDDNLTVEKVLSWNIDQYVKPACGKKIYDYLRQPDLYDNIAVIDGALEGVSELRKMGYRVVFASAGIHQGKVDALIRNGFITTEKDYIGIADKSLLDGLFLIDDGMHNIQAFKSGIGILFDAPHNQQYFYGRRAMGWKQVIQIVKRSEAVIELLKSNMF